MVKITQDMIETSYIYGLLTYNNQISKQSAILKINEESNMNLRSAQIYITILCGMLDGKEFHRTMSIASFVTFLKNIKRDYNKDRYIGALYATQDHTKYWYNTRGTHLRQLEQLINDLLKGEE